MREDTAMKFILVSMLAALTVCGGELLILHKGGNSLGYYSEDGRLLQTVQVGQHPHEMIRSADGRFVYITDNGTMRIEQPGTGGNTVSIVDIAARKKVGEIALGDYRRPHGIDLAAQPGLLAVTSELPDRLLLIDPNTRKVVRSFETKGKTSHMVSFGPGGKSAYVSNSGSASVAAIDLTSGAVKVIGTGERPEGSVLSRDGKYLYVTCRESAEIVVIDTAKNEAVGRIATGKGPVRITLAPDGMLVYATMHDPGVEVADPAARKVIARIKVPQQVVSIGLSSDGRRAFASAEEQQIVYVVSLPDRKILREIRTAAGMNPDPVIER
jgi:YVTN family beta-propeller protein